ncbi:MAG: LysM peptidoglycan-binding domain-containing protein, partial [Candidatus Cryptobacteroides sp.]
MKAMQIRNLKYVVALAVCLGGTPAYAQSYTPTPVTVSAEKVKVNGKLYYSHVVLERQTLYSISKAYGVSIADIKKANPGIEGEGLRKNSIILIPVTGKTEASATESVKAEKQPEEKKTVPEREPQTYTVRWFDTLESIAEKFGVSPEALAQANGIKDGKLKARDVLVIPEESQAVASVQETEVESAAVPVEVLPGQDIQENAPEDEESPLSFRKDRTDIALVLPFKAKSANPSTSALDFYSGVLMAVKKLSSEGLNINLRVFDSADEIRAFELRPFDFVIGPISPDEIAGICEKAGNIPVISPLDPRTATLTSQHSNLIQVPTPHEIQYADLIQWMLQENSPGDRIVLVREKNARKEPGMNELVNILNLTGAEYSTISYSILEGRDIIDTFRETACPDCIIEVGSDGKKKTLSNPDGKVTRFLIASESEAFVNDVVRNINLLSHENNKVEIYCHSKVRGYDIEASSLHDNNLHVSLAYWIDYDNPEVISFVKAYRALMNTEPTQFSFQGYDITYWFAKNCAENGRNWANKLDSRKEDLLQMSFDFNAETRINEGVKRIIYLPG